MVIIPRWPDCKASAGFCVGRSGKGAKARKPDGSAGGSGRYRGDDVKLLVVDDEDFTRRCISEQIDWNAYDVEVVGTAADGEDAWEKICALKPDILIIDIKMPKLNGLELLSKVQKSYPDIDAVILSGFDEFEFAQKALNYGAKSYLLKPVDLSELLSVVITLQEKKIQGREKKEGQNGIETFLRSLIYMEYTPESLDEMYESAGWAWEYWQSVILLQMEDISEALCIGAYNILLKKLKQRCENSRECYLLEKSPQNIMIYILAPEKAQAENAAQETVELIRRVLNEADYHTYTVGVSAANPTIEESGKSYLEASRAVNMKFIYGSGKEYYAASQQWNAPGKALSSNKLIRDIVENTVYYNEDKVDGLAEHFFDEAKKKKIRIEDIRQAIYLVLTGIIKHEALVNINISSLYANTGAVIMAFCNCDDELEMRRKLKSFLHTIGRRLSEVKIRKPNQTVIRIEQYIRDHYMQTDLSLSKIAEEFNFSPAYLSTLFKNNCSQNITDYINAVRVEAACRMLLEDEAKVSWISEAVGYSNTTYFNKVFKKIKGCSPKDYREGFHE